MNDLEIAISNMGSVLSDFVRILSQVVNTDPKGAEVIVRYYLTLKTVVNNED